jgi:hypothetical protein
LSSGKRTTKGRKGILKGGETPKSNGNSVKGLVLRIIKIKNQSELQISILEKTLRI